MKSAPPIPGRAKALVSIVLLLDALLAVPLIEGWQSGQLNHSILLFLLPFNLFALGWVLEILSRWILGRSLEPEGLQFGRDGDGEWADFRRLGPVKFSLGILFATSFVLMFFTFRVSNERLATAWPVLVVLGGALWLGKVVFNHGRSRRYRYSVTADVLQIPTGDRIPGAGVSLRIEERRSPRGDKVRCRPVLTVDDSGTVRDVVLPWSFGREKSDQFCDWFERCRR